MRFYKIAIYRANGELFIPPSMEGLKLKDCSYTSVLDGITSPITSALDVLIDVSVFSATVPRSAKVILSGVSLKDIGQMNYLVNGTIDVFGGMLDGYLPLSKHYGDRLVSGALMYTAGNWEGTNISMELQISLPPGLSPEAQKAGTALNMTLNWPVGEKLEPGLRELLQKTYGKSASNPKGYDIKIEISDRLVARSQQSGVYNSLSAMGDALQKYTRDQFRDIPRLDGGKYMGIQITFPNKGVMLVSDGTKPGGVEGTHGIDKPLQILFQDMIGQPSWKSANVLVFKTVMRGDITIGDYIKMPKGLRSPYVTTQTGPGNAPNTEEGIKLPSKNAIAFDGKFNVIDVRHVGQFRQATANSWVTVIECFYVDPEEAKPLTEHEKTVREQEKQAAQKGPLFTPTPNWPPPNPATPLERAVPVPEPPPPVVFPGR